MVIFSGFNCLPSLWPCYFLISLNTLPLIMIEAKTPRSIISTFQFISSDINSAIVDFRVTAPDSLLGRYTAISLMVQTPYSRAVFLIRAYVSLHSLVWAPGVLHDPVVFFLLVRIANDEHGVVDVLRAFQAIIVVDAPCLCQYRMLDVVHA